MDFVPVALPALAVLLYGVIKTRGEWDGTLWKSFLIGGVAAAICIPVEIALFSLLPPADPVAATVLMATLITAVPEEFAKFFALVGIAERYVAVRRKQDILLLAVGVSLGFAVLAGIFFVVINYDSKMSVTVGHAAAALPVNAINSLIMGALLIGARLQSRSRLLVPALAVPVLLHALYDFPFLASALRFAVLLLSAVLAIYLCNRFLQAASRADAASARDTRKAMRSGRYVRFYLIGGTVLIVSGVAVIAVLQLTNSSDFAWMGAAAATVPVALGLDLIWDGLRPYRLP
jgi:RsiW-degrading membrane proteinase PrsW (M82 family)